MSCVIVPVIFRLAPIGFPSVPGLPPLRSAIYLQWTVGPVREREERGGAQRRTNQTSSWDFAV